MEIVTLIFPVLVAVTTEILKQVPKIPVESHNAKLTALILSSILICGISYQAGTFTLDNAVITAGSITVVYTMAIGVYETVKKIWQTI